MKKSWKLIAMLAAAVFLVSACQISAESLPVDATPTMNMTGMGSPTEKAEPSTLMTDTMTDTMPMPSMAGMGSMSSEFTSDELAPLVLGIYEGEDLFFIHTEASDPTVARMLTEMMGPEVIVVPELAQAPTELLGNVYVFANGIPGHGPMGFQPDVFDSVPGDSAYRPLRMIQRVSWLEGASLRQLNSAAEIAEAEADGEIMIEQTGIIVNMPILVWPGPEGSPDGANHR